jgi:4-diphosphocytidyl-2-C-methyl-D-erythritol kinase
MEQLTLPAPAKLNLFLHITGQREDGYHELQTIFQFIDRSDTLRFVTRNDHLIVLHTKMHGVPPEENLCVRAAKEMQKHDRKRRGVDIYLEKNIPIGGGLGGGSSDAATTIVGLNSLWELHLPHNQLLQLGVQLGADIPVFIKGKACWAEGIGEIMTPIDLAEPWYVVIIPPVTVPTAEIFFDKQLTRDTPKRKMAPSLVESGHNDCEAVVSRRYPEVAEAMKWLNQYDHIGKSRLTGSGACVFAAFNNEQDARDVVNKVEAPFKAFAAKGQNTSPLLKSIESIKK